MRFSAIQKEIRSAGTPERAKASAWFFKTGEGQYGYGDKFLGLTVPQSRIIAKKYRDLSLSDVERLLRSEYHEDRLIALLILVDQYTKGIEYKREEIYRFYLSHTKWINNWDLVDLSAEYIVGEYLLRHSGAKRSGAIESQVGIQKRSYRAFALQDDGLKVLKKLAGSESVWERRIAIISTFAFIKNGKSQPTFRIAEILIHDKHDLIQKAVGWMLREVGKRVSQADEEAFLKRHYKTMPRTMLRYAIERFDPTLKKAYMIGAA